MRVRYNQCFLWAVSQLQDSGGALEGPTCCLLTGSLVVVT